MKKFYLIYSFLILLNKFAQISLQYNSIYDPEDFIDYINNKEILTKENYDSIINYLINIFNDAYAFNEVSINPEQPAIQNDYRSIAAIIRCSVLFDAISIVMGSFNLAIFSISFGRTLFLKSLIATSL